MLPEATNTAAMEGMSGSTGRVANAPKSPHRKRMNRSMGSWRTKAATAIGRVADA